MYGYASPPRSKRGPTVASNLGRKAAASSAQAQASLHRRAGSPRPVASPSGDGLGSAAQKAEASGWIGVAASRGQQGRSAREAFVAPPAFVGPGDAQFKVPAQKTNGAGQSAVKGAHEGGGSTLSSLLKTRTGARFDGRAVVAEASPAQQRPTPYSRPQQSPSAHSRGASQALSSSSAGVQVAIVEGLALVPHASQTTQQHESAPVDIDGIYYQYDAAALRQAQEAKRSMADRNAPTLGDGSGRYSSSPTPQSEGVRQPRDRSDGASRRGQKGLKGFERAAPTSDEPSQSRQVREASARPPAPQRQNQLPVHDDAYSHYFQQPGTVGQVEEVDDDGVGIDTDIASDEDEAEGRFQEIANAESDQFDYDTRAEASQAPLDADPALVSSSGGGWSAASNGSRAGASGSRNGASEQWGPMDAGPLINEILGERQDEIVANARARWAAIGVNDTEAWLDGGREYAQRFVDLNKSITDYAVGSSANFASISEDVTAYERDLERTAKKLESYANDLEKWGADITSSSRQ